MLMKKYYRIEYGFEKDQFLSIPEEDLKSAMRAQVTGMVFISSETGESRSGNTIQGIKPDWQRMLGLNPEHRLTGADYLALSDGTVSECRQALLEARAAVTEGDHRRLGQGS